MSTYTDFLGRLAKRLDELEAEKVKNLVAGQWDDKRGRELVGEIRGYRNVRDAITDIQKQTEERTQK